MSLKSLALTIAVAVASACVADRPATRLLLESQQDVEDAAGTVEAESVFITGSVNSLTPLRSLVSVVLSITVTHADALTSLAGLENVRDPKMRGTSGLQWDIEVNAGLTDVSAIRGQPAGVDFNDNPALARILLPALTEVDRLGIGERAAATLSAPMLHTVADSLTIAEAPLLCTVDLPALTTLGALVVFDLGTCWPREEREDLARRTGANLVP